jgi:hypothetical protein
MPPFGPQRNIKHGKKPSLKLKKTIRELAFYYRNYKTMFIVAIILSLIAGICTTAAILLNGYLYSLYIIPSMLVEISIKGYGLFGLVSFL